MNKKIYKIIMILSIMILTISLISYVILGRYFKTAAQIQNYRVFPQVQRAGQTV